jgi:hypothetical protein
MSPVKAALKRGALVAAANWQVILIQEIADSLFKLLIAVPAVGGAFFVALVIGAEPEGLMTLEWREMVTTVIGALLSQPLVLIAFLLSLTVVVIGGSLFMFLVKAGTVATLANGDRTAGAVEHAPLHLSVFTEASAFSIDGFIAACVRFVPRYARLGFTLIGVYALSGIALLVAVVMSDVREGLSVAALLTTLFVCWITLVNLLYLLTQIILVADECTIAEAGRRMVAFVRGDFRGVASVFGVVLGIVVLGTGVSVLAMGALGLIAFVPFFGLAVLPLQLLAWLFRGLVFQYVGLASVGAYLTRYRAFRARASAASLVQDADRGAPSSGWSPGPASSSAATTGRTSAHRG